MTETIPRHYIYGIIIFMMIIVGGVTFLGGFFEASKDFGNEDTYKQFNRSFNKIDEIHTKVDKLEKSVTSSTQEQSSIWGFLDGLINSVWFSISTLTTSMSFMKDIFTNLHTMFGIPIWATTSITALITIMIIFSIFSVIFKKDI